MRKATVKTLMTYNVEYLIILLGDVIEIDKKYAIRVSKVITLKLEAVE